MTTASASTIPEDFLPEEPSETRRSLWEDTVGSNVTEIAKQLSSGQLTVPSGQLVSFQKGWRKLSEERSEIPAHRCRLRRKLIYQFYHDLVELYDQHEIHDQR